MDFIYNKQFSEKLKKENNSSNALVCVIIDGFDKEIEDIKKTVLSVASSTLKAIEIAVLTSSKDIKKFCEIDQRISIINNKRSVNKVISEIEKIPFFTIISAGEFIAEQYLETSYLTLTFNNSNITYTDTINYKDEKVYNYMFDYKILRNKYLPVPNLFFRSILRDKIFNYSISDIKTWEFFSQIIKDEKIIHQSYYGFYTNKSLSDLNNKTYPIIEKEVFKASIDNYPKEEYYWEIIKSKKGILSINKKNNKKTNILLIIPWMNIGGADRFNIELIRLINKDKYNVSIITDHPKEYVWRQEFEKYISDVFEMASFINRSDWPTFIEYMIDTRDIDLVMISNSTFGYNLIPFLKMQYPKLPIIDYIHSAELYNRNGGYARDSMAMTELIDKTLICNKSAEKMCNELFNIPKEKTDTVYIGVDTDIFSPNEKLRKQVREKYNLENNITIGYICRIGKEKRPLLLAEIIKESIKDNPNYKFIIAGDGILLNEFKRKIKAYELENNVIFLGSISNTKEFYSMCDITINCSIKEGLALTAYESLSMSVPILSADVGGHKELIDDKVGYIVPLLQEETEIENYNYTEEEVNNYVSGLKYITSNLDRLKRNCRKRILASFSLNKMIENMENNIDDIIKNPNKKVLENAKLLKIFKNTIYENYNHYLMGTQYEYQTLINKYYSFFNNKIPKVDSGPATKHSEEYYLTRRLGRACLDIATYPFKLSKIEIRKLRERKK